MSNYGFKCKNGHMMIDSATTSFWRCPTCEAPMIHDINVPGGYLEPYAWPGGYTIIYVDAEGEVMCAECAETYRDDPDNKPIDRDVYYEGPPETCCDCGKELESSYGDPDTDDRAEA